MVKKPQISVLWGQLKAALSVHETIAPEQNLPASRLKQIETRCGGLTQKCAEQDLELIDNLASQKTTVGDNSLRWSCNPDKGIKQDIRKIHQLGGVSRGFSIDPLADIEK